MKNEIICDGLRKSIKGKDILRGVTLKATQGQVIALLGPNGAGKTTAFSILCGLLRPSSGRVFFNDKDITDVPMYKRARMGIGYLPQESSVFRGLSVEENIYAVLDMNGYSKSEKNVILEKLLQDLELDHIRKSPSVSISGGERRKLEIARALATNPKFILLDEPFAGIDPLAIAEMQNMIINLKKRNIGIVITDHNVRDTLPLADYAYLLFDGKVLMEGTAKEIINSKDAQKIYLGESFSGYNSLHDGEEQ
ncbi:MAG: LPS export ABC transporter ATP-binding protein [Alphaproteobacteria bacterium]|nr:LPS export ABC transporter ATP-binding protein [Alphaproteobacteria bacterium]